MNRPTAIRVSAGTAEPAVEDDESEPSVPDAENLVAEAVVLAAAQDADPELVARYWRLVPDEELAGRQVAWMVEATRSHLELAQQRVPGELKLRLGTSIAGGTSLEIVTDDMPFLVDSVTSALSSRNIDMNMLVHPLVVVRRAPLGALERVRVGLEPEDAAPGDIVESWIRIEVDQIRDEADLEELRNDLARVLDDVREAVEDWPKMRIQALALADELGWPSCRCRTRTSPTPSSCCAGSSTTTSRSWASGSTA